MRAALLLESHLEKRELCQQYRAQVQEHPRRDDILERQGAQPAHRRQEDKRHRGAPVHERHHANAPRHVRHPARRKEKQDSPERTSADPMRKNPPVRDKAGRNRARHLRRQRRRGGSRAQFETELHPHRTRPQEHSQNQGQARRQPLLPRSILENNPGPRQPERIKEGEASPCLQPWLRQVFRTPPPLGTPPLKPWEAEPFNYIFFASMHVFFQQDDNKF